MSSDSAKILSILEDVKSLLETEQRLFGDVLYYETPHVRRGEGAATPIAPTIAVKNIPHTPKSKEMASKRPIPEIEEDELFALPEAPRPSITTEAWGSVSSLDELSRQICECQKCPLGATRTNFVFGVGNPKASLMLIGEAPGADEDAQGEPFVGRAGQLLNKIIEAIHFKRSDVYICNILKCRPPNNRKPTVEESELCKPYLKKQIELVKPKVILCLGLTAAENLLGTTESMSRLRGRVMKYEGVPVMVTYHPAALLRNPNWKRPAWEDVQAARKLHDELMAKQHDDG